LRARSATVARCTGARAVISTAAATEGIAVSAAAGTSGTTARQVPVADAIGAAGTSAVRGSRARSELAGSVACSARGTKAAAGTESTAPRADATTCTIAAAGAEIVSPDRIALNPDCGFAPDFGEPPTIDEAFEKLSRLTAAAQRLRRRFRR